jgi:hypothetical protein
LPPGFVAGHLPSAQPGAADDAGERAVHVRGDRVAVVQPARIDDEGVVRSEDGEVGVVPALDPTVVLQTGDLRRPLPSSAPHR